MALDGHALIGNYLDPQRIAPYRLVDPAQVAETVRRFRAGEGHLSFRVWLLSVLLAWLERHWVPLHGRAPNYDLPPTS